MSTTHVKTTRASRRSLPTTAPARWAWRTVDAGLFVAVPVTALCLGGRHDLGRLIYVLGVALASVGWLAATLIEGPSKRPTRAYALIAAAVGVVFFQLIPLPQGWLARLAPGLSERLTLWPSSGAEASPLGVWETVSSAPGETRLGLALLVAHAALFLVVLKRLHRLQDVERLVARLAGLVGGAAGLAFVQWLAPNGHALWVYDHPSRDFIYMQGTFANQNHFAHFVTLGLPACLLMAWRAHAAWRRPERGASRSSNKRLLALIGWSAATALSIATPLMSQSRGGIVALVVSLGACLVMMRRHQLIKTRVGPAPMAIAAGGLIVILLIGQSALTDTAQLSNALADGTLAEEADRADIWRANRHAFAASPWLGWGAGTHRWVYPVFFDAGASTEFTHAESGYLQIATETGVAGLTLLAAAALLVLSWSVKLMRRLPPEYAWTACAVVPPLLVSFVHSFGDFAWYLPACLGLTVTIAAAALRLAQLSTGGQAAEVASGSSSWSPGWALPTSVTLGVGLAVLTYVGPGRAAGDWDQYLRVSRSAREYALAAAQGASEEAVRRRNLIASNERMLELLDRVLEKNPDHLLARLRRSTRLRQLVDLTAPDRDNAMGVSQLCDAALRSEFASPEETHAWLETVCGDSARLLGAAHTDAANTLRLSPLIGHAYLALADLAVLSPPNLRDKQALVTQAITVRPYDGPMLFEAGLVMQRLGEGAIASELWRRSCKDPGSHFETMVTLVCRGGAPASAFLAEIKPPWQVFARASRRYLKLGREDDLRALAAYAVELAEGYDDPSDPRVAGAWMMAAKLHARLGDPTTAIEDLFEAYASLPNRFAVRYQLAKALLDAGRVQEAEPHLRWCLARRPDSNSLRKSLAKARRAARLLAAANTTKTRR